LNEVLNLTVVIFLLLYMVCQSSSHGIQPRKDKDADDSLVNSRARFLALMKERVLKHRSLRPFAEKGKELIE
jgi:hypothetical protein